MTASNRHPAAPADDRPSDAQHALRVLHLDQAIRRWLALDTTPGNGHRLLGAHLSRWLRVAETGPLFERLPALVAELQVSFPAAKGRSAGDFDKAFAAALTQQAFAEVAREAGRSGRADAFVCLKPYLHEDPSASELEHLAHALALSPTAIELALASLRRRLRGRVEAALDLWSDSAESRDTLRRSMRAALTEGTP
jgi:hypothetical protein